MSVLPDKWFTPGKLPYDGDAPLLTTPNDTLTRDQFFAEVSRYTELCKNSPELLQGDFAVIHCEEPFEYLPLLFGLLNGGARISFPTRDYFVDPSLFAFCRHRIKVNKGEIVVEENESFEPPVGVPEDTNVIGYSSGSTGLPKGICHNFENFFTNAESVNNYLGLEGCVSITPLKPYLVSALSHFLVHLVSGSELHFVDNSELGAIGDKYRLNKEAALVGSPMHITTGVRHIPDDASPRYFFSSGDFMYAGAIAEIFKRFPKSEFYKVYGLAELAGRFFINRLDANSSFEVYEELGDSLPEIEYEFRDKEVFINGKLLSTGYLRAGEFQPIARPHPTGDLAIENEKGIFLYGRKNDEIKVAGNKVSLKYIEGKVSRVFPKSSSVMIAVPHKLFGNTLALVVSADDKPEKKELMKQLRGTLDKHEMPHHYFFMKDLPLTQSSKIDRKRIAEKLSDLKEL